MIQRILWPTVLGCVLLTSPIAHSATLSINNRIQVKIKKDKNTQTMQGEFQLNESLWADVAKDDEQDARSYAYILFEDDFIHFIQTACWGGRLSGFSAFSINAMQAGTQTFSSHLMVGAIARQLFPRIAHHIALSNAEPCSPAFVRHYESIEIASRTEKGKENGYTYDIQLKSAGMFNKTKKWVVKFNYDYTAVQRKLSSIPEVVAQ